MNMVSIKCPNCGGKVIRKENEYFGRCPFCDNEVAFNDIREEAEVGAFKERLSELERDKDTDQKNKQLLRTWFRKRNIYFVALFLINFAGWFLVGCSSEFGAKNLTGFGAILMIVAGCLFLSMPPSLGFSYPAYNVLYEKEEHAGKVIMWLKLIGISVALLILSLLLVYATIQLFK